MWIGNIVSKDKINVGPEFKVYDTLDEVVYKDLPTLIVGCEIVRTIYGKDIDLINRKLSDTLFWTFSKKELRNKYFNDLEDFMQYSFDYSIKKLKYLYFDIIQFSDKKIKKVIKKIYSFDKVYTYHNNMMLYVYSEDIIIGVDLELFKYVNLDYKRVLDKIKSKSNVFLSGNELLIEYKNYMDRLDDKIRFIPFIYSINNNE